MSLQTVGHLIIAAHFWYGCYYDWFYVILPPEVMDLGDTEFNSGKLKFLTYWDALLQAVFFTICFLNDVLGTNEHFPKTVPLFRRLKDFLLPSLAFPLAMFVGLSFWGLYFIDRELIFPKMIDAFFPSWLNHVMHTNIMIFSLLELLTSYRQYPSRKKGITILLIFMVIYLIWLHIIYAYTNKWVYPILAVLNFPARLGFFLSNVLISVGAYILGEKINTARWGSKIEPKPKKKV